MNVHDEHAKLFKRAIHWLHERGGYEAVLEAFGDAEDVNRVWELGLDAFKDYLRGRCRVALQTARRGAA